MKPPSRLQLAARAAWHIVTGRPFVLALHGRDGIEIDTAMPPNHLDGVARYLHSRAEERRCHATADALLEAAGIARERAEP